MSITLGADEQRRIDITLTRVPTTFVVKASKDTSLEQYDPDFNRGGGITIDVGWYGIEEGTGIEGRVRSLIEFPINWGVDIPTGATIRSAIFSLYIYNLDGATAIGQSVFAQRLLRLDWKEMEATWNVYKVGYAWTAGGADAAQYDYTTAGMAEAFMPNSDDIWVDWNITTQVKWAQSNRKNVAIRLKGNTEAGGPVWGVAFCSRNYYYSTYFPKLTIVY